MTNPGRHMAVSSAAFMPAHQPDDSDEDVFEAQTFMSFGDNAPRCSSSHVGVNFEIIPGRLSFAIHRDDDETIAAINDHPYLFYFSSWMQESYQPFNSDFGPVNLAAVVRFCDFFHEKMEDKRLVGRHLVYYSDAETAHSTNTAFLICAYLVLVQKWEPNKAAAPFDSIKPSPFKPFRDATDIPSTFDLHLVDCLNGLQRAVDCGFFSYEGFNTEAYEQLDDIDYADAHIICPKFLAFRGPNDRASLGGMCNPPRKYLRLFEYLNIEAVVRLNEVEYDKTVFEEASVAHHELFFEDCTSPSNDVVRAFFRICDAHPGMIAVHCRAGLGRTGTLIAAWIMSNYGWTAREAIGWLRIVRPGSVIGPQQHFLELFECSLTKVDLASQSLVACEKLARSTTHSQLIASQISVASDRKLDQARRSSADYCGAI